MDGFRDVEKERANNRANQAPSACEPGTPKSEENCYVQRRSKRIKLTPKTVNVCIICGSAIRTTNKKKSQIAASFRKIYGSKVTKCY